MEPMKPMQPMKPMEPMKPMKPMAPMDPVRPWWPEQLGQPASTGSQNDARYAYFPDKQRLVVETGGRSTTYDTGPTRIQGFGQQQGASGAMSFQTADGSVDLASLKIAD